MLRRPLRRNALAPVISAALLVACGSSDHASAEPDSGRSDNGSGGGGGNVDAGGTGGAPSAGDPLTLTSSVFQEGATIP